MRRALKGLLMMGQNCELEKAPLIFVRLKGEALVALCSRLSSEDVCIADSSGSWR